MKNTVKITLIGKQWDENGGETLSETVFSGEYYERNGSIYLFYREIPQGMDTAVENRIKLKGSLLEITKKGALNTRMLFEPGREYLTDYSTPFGCVKIGIRTSAVNCLRRKEGLTMEAEYTLTSGGQPFSRCFVIIKADYGKDTLQ